MCDLSVISPRGTPPCKGAGSPRPALPGQGRVTQIKGSAPGNCHGLSLVMLQTVLFVLLELPCRTVSVGACRRRRSWSPLEWLCGGCGAAQSLQRVSIICFRAGATTPEVGGRCVACVDLVACLRTRWRRTRTSHKFKWSLDLHCQVQDGFMQSSMPFGYSLFIPFSQPFPTCSLLRS